MKNKERQEARGLSGWFLSGELTQGRGRPWRGAESEVGF